MTSFAFLLIGLLTLLSGRPSVSGDSFPGQRDKSVETALGASCSFHQLRLLKYINQSAQILCSCQHNQLACVFTDKTDNISFPSLGTHKPISLLSLSLNVKHL